MKCTECGARCVSTGTTATATQYECPECCNMFERPIARPVRVVESSAAAGLEVTVVGYSKSPTGAHSIARSFGATLIIHEPATARTLERYVVCREGHHAKASS